MEEFAVFGVIYEVSMLQKEVRNETEISVGLGFGMSDQNPENDGLLCCILNIIIL